MHILIFICIILQTNDAIRAAAFTLFGALWRFGQDSAADVFYEQIHSNLPSIVLHINDDSVKVQNVCGWFCIYMYTHTYIHTHRIKILIFKLRFQFVFD